jgi:hypothetical protein
MLASNADPGAAVAVVAREGEEQGRQYHSHVRVVNPGHLNLSFNTQTGPPSNSARRFPSPLDLTRQRNRTAAMAGWAVVQVLRAKLYNCGQGPLVYWWWPWQQWKRSSQSAQLAI